VNEVCGTEWSDLIGQHTPAVSSPGLGTELGRCRVRVVVVARSGKVCPGVAWNGNQQQFCQWVNNELRGFLFQSRRSVS